MTQSEIEARKAELEAQIDNADAEKLAEIRSQIEALKAEKPEESKLDERNLLKEPAKVEERAIQEMKKIEKPKEEKKMEEKNILETAEYRSAFLKKLQGKRLNEEEERALTTAAESVGSVIPTTTLNKVEENLRQSSALYPFVTVLNVPGYLSIPKEGTTNDANWVEEGTAAQDSADTTTSVSFAAYKLIKTISITAEVSAMAIDAFEAFLVKKLAEKMKIALENAILNGTGDGQPKGVLVETYTAANSLTYSTMAYTDITGLIALLKSGYKPNAKFAVNSKTLWSVIANIVDENKKPIFIPNIENGFAGKILGIPVIEDEYAPDGTVVLGDWSKFTFNFNKPIELASDTSTEFRKGDKVYRAMAIVDGKTVNTEAFVKLSKTAASV